MLRIMEAAQHLLAALFYHIRRTAGSDMDDRWLAFAAVGQVVDSVAPRSRSSCISAEPEAATKIDAAATIQHPVWRPGETDTNSKGTVFVTGI